MGTALFIRLIVCGSIYVYLLSGLAYIWLYAFTYAYNLAKGAISESFEKSHLSDSFDVPAGCTSAKDIALIYMLHSTGEKCYYTNFGINFYLYVISGKKFRSDLVTLLKDICKFCYCKARLSRESSFSNITTTTSANED